MWLPVSVRIFDSGTRRVALAARWRPGGRSSGAGAAAARWRGGCGRPVPGRRGARRCCGGGSGRRRGGAGARAAGGVDVVEHVVAGDASAGAGAGDRSGSRPCSFTSRRTTGDSSRLSLAAAAARRGAGSGSGGRRRRRRAAAAGAGAGAAGAAGGGGRWRGLGGRGGLGRRWRFGAARRPRPGRRRGAAAGAASLSPTTAITVPTSTVSPSGTRISVSTPDTGDGTSVSTLSVRHLEQRLVGGDRVADVLEPLRDRAFGDGLTELRKGDVCHVLFLCLSVDGCGRWCGRWCGRCGGQPLKLRPVSDSTVSPNSSDRLGWGWMNSAISSTVASQLTAR